MYSITIDFLLLVTKRCGRCQDFAMRLLRCSGRFQHVVFKVASIFWVVARMLLGDCLHRAL